MPSAELTSLGHLAGKDQPTWYILALALPCSLFSEESRQPGKSLGQAPSLSSSPTSQGLEALIDAWLGSSPSWLSCAEWPQTSPFTALSLRFPICKTRSILAPSSWVVMNIRAHHPRSSQSEHSHYADGKTRAKSHEVCSLTKLKSGDSRPVCRPVD